LEPRVFLISTNLTDRGVITYHIQEKNRSGLIVCPRLIGHMEVMEKQKHILAKELFDAVIFDMDGVITRTAALHFNAWKRLFDDFLRRRAAATATEFTPFTEEDYRRYVDGKPRADGVVDFLASRGIALPFGAPDEPPDQETVHDLGNRKNEYFQEELQQTGPMVFDSSVRLIRELRERGFKIGLVSSSKNTASVIDGAGLADCFDAKADGIDLETIKLPGKPAPDLFLLVAEELGVDPTRAVVVEDARAGVEAGRRGRFGLVIGVAREGDPAVLRQAGADIVVNDLAEITSEGELLPPMANTANLPSALDRFDEITSGWVERRPVVFLDYDGTLTPIVRHPREAILSTELRETLARLARLTTVAVISGRDLADIRGKVELPDIHYAGSHGFDIAGPAGENFVLEKGAEYLDALDQAGQVLEEKLAGLAGVWLERKKFALAVHYREAGEEVVLRLDQMIEELLADHAGLRKSGGKKIIELRPDIDWDKGRAIGWLLQRLGLDRPDILPLYLGDDLTDEDAFRALRENGLGIVVRDEPRPTAALYGLDDPGQVRTFLDRTALWLEKDRR
jgi:trehalose-phosphatase